MSTPQQRKLQPLAVVALISAIVLLTIVPLALRPLFNLNEGLYAEIPREMLHHGWLIPRLDGMPYLEKPPVFYWLVMIFYKTIGINKIAARLPSALAALGTLWIVFRFARSRTPAPLWPPLILFTSVGFYLMSQLAMFDMTFTLFHTITLLAFFAYIENPKRASALYVAAAASAMACMTKGLIGIALPGFIVIVFLILERRTIRVRHFLWAWALFFVIALPWHIWMTLHVPHFFDRYIIQEHFGRFLGTLKPSDYRRPPVYYNLEHLLLGVFPWTPFLLAALWHRRPYDRLDRFLLIWAAVYVAFFTISKTSSAYYTLPAIPALALFTGRALPALAGRLLGSLIALFALVICAFALAVPRLPHADTHAYLLAMALTYAAFFLLAVPNRARIGRRLSVAAVGALAGFIASFLLFIHAHPSRFASRNLAAAIRPDLTPHAYVFVANRYENLSSFDFYVDRPIFVFNPSQGDLYYGIRHDKKVTRLITGGALKHLLHHGHVFIAGSRSQRRSWDKLGHFRVIAENRHDVVVENVSDKGPR